MRWAFLLYVSLMVSYLSASVTLLPGAIMDAGGANRVKCMDAFNQSSCSYNQRCKGLITLIDKL